MRRNILLAIRVMLACGALVAGCAQHPERAGHGKVAPPRDAGLEMERQATICGPAPAEPKPAPFLKAIPGRPGFYYETGANPAESPIDAHAFSPGDEVRSPYTQKIYRVPYPAKSEGR